VIALIGLQLGDDIEQRRIALQSRCQANYALSPESRKLHILYQTLSPSLTINRRNPVPAPIASANGAAGFFRRAYSDTRLKTGRYEDCQHINKTL
jgi:hypothetical protein